VAARNVAASTSSSPLSPDFGAYLCCICEKKVAILNYIICKIHYIIIQKTVKKSKPELGSCK